VGIVNGKLALDVALEHMNNGQDKWPVHGESPSS